MHVCVHVHANMHIGGIVDIAAGGRRQDENKQNLKTGEKHRHLQGSSLEARNEMNLKAGVKGFSLCNIYTITQRALVI